MGILMDAVKKLFKRKGKVSPVVEQVETDEFFEAVNEYISRGGSMIFKQSKAPAVLVAVGFGKEYNNKLAIRKSKSQQRNWSKWRRRK